MALHNAVALIFQPLDDTVPGNVMTQAKLLPKTHKIIALGIRECAACAAVETQLHAGGTADFKLADRVTDEPSSLLNCSRFDSSACLAM